LDSDFKKILDGLEPQSYLLYIQTLKGELEL
jgi:hypothetical protein